MSTHRSSKSGMTLLSVMIFALASMMILVSMFAASNMGRRINVRDEDAHAVYLACKQEIDRLEHEVKNGGIDALFSLAGGQATVITNYPTSFHRSAGLLNTQIPATRKIELIPGITAGCSNLSAIVTMEWSGVGLIGNIRSSESVMAVFYKY